MPEFIAPRRSRRQKYGAKHRPHADKRNGKKEQKKLPRTNPRKPFRFLFSAPNTA
jgi:hypothetical protein